MELTALYQEITQRIEKIDFSTLWKGFSPLGFALYTKEECCLNGKNIQKASAFCGNTAIPWEDGYIAIWNVSKEPEDLDALSASIIHEMFHAFQMLSNEQRFPNEQEALFCYSYCVGNLSAKYKEAALIRSILKDDDRNAWCELLSLRKMRAETFPYEYEYEARIEQIEGTARFVELSALAQLNAEKAALTWQKLFDQIIQPEQYFPIRQISYEIGAAVIACIQKFSDMELEAFSGQPFSYEMIAGAESGKFRITETPEMDEPLNRYLNETHRIIKAAILKNDCILKGRYPLISVNLWDARREGYHIISNQFLLYQDGEEAKTLQGDFVITVDSNRSGCNILAVFRQ